MKLLTGLTNLTNIPDLCPVRDNRAQPTDNSISDGAAWASKELVAAYRDYWAARRLELKGGSRKEPPKQAPCRRFGAGRRALSSCLREVARPSLHAAAAVGAPHTPDVWPPRTLSPDISFAALCDLPRQARSVHASASSRTTSAAIAELPGSTPLSSPSRAPLGGARCRGRHPRYAPNEIGDQVRRRYRQHVPAFRDLQMKVRDLFFQRLPMQAIVQKPIVPSEQDPDRDAQ